MRKPTPELREQIRRTREEGRLANENMQQILDRVDARRRARLARRQRGPFGRLLSFLRAA